MTAAPQGLKGLGKYFGAVGEGPETDHEAAAGGIVDKIANAPALLRKNAGDSVIGSELHVRGTLMCTGDMTINGTINGDIRGKGHVTIGESGVVLGNIYAEEISVHGIVEGTLNARKVRLCRSCHVKGDVVHARLEVEDGAFFEGDCGHSDNPAGDLSLTEQ